MKKHFFLITMLLCGIFSSASAQEVVIKDIEGPSSMCQIDLRDLMYANHVSNGLSKARQFAGPSDAVVNYEDRITNMPQFIRDFIGKYVEAGNAVLAGGSNWLSNPALGKEDESGRYYYLLAEVPGTASFTFPAGSSSETVKQAAQNAYSAHYDDEYDILLSFMPFACLSLNFDHPEFFWIGNSFDYGSVSNYSVSYNSSAGTGTVTYTISHRFFLHTSSFDIRTRGVSNYNFRDLTQLANGVTRFQNAVQTILSKCNTYSSRYDKLVAAHDWLTQHNCYNPFYPEYPQSSIGDTPWSAFSAMEGNSGQQAPVCEGYSRAFKVLCDKMDIPCILMTGIAQREKDRLEDHMWNYVQMENGKWYAIDVTWDDPVVNGNYDIVSGHESHYWFLMGSTTSVVDGLTFIESHPEQWANTYPNEGNKSWDLLAGPELAPTVWTSTSLEKCATPTISYVNGKLKFKCETEGVQFFSTITDNDIKSFNTAEIDLSVTYTISVYATKTGYENSNVATGTLCWIEQQPNMEGIVAEDAVTEVKALPVLIQSQGGIITVQGALEGTPIAIYDTSGKQYGTTVGKKSGATIATALCPGSVAIVKIGEKSVKLVIK